MWANCRMKFQLKLSRTSNSTHLARVSKKSSVKKMVQCKLALGLPVNLGELALILQSKAPQVDTMLRKFSFDQMK
jgi:hypothetical protein